ncbi:MAG: PQQ-dependent sugar dehydrogenase [Candidatus Binatia bacterium]
MLAQDPPSTGEHTTVTLAPHIGGLRNPVHITHAGDGSQRLFIVEQEGRIRIIKDGVLRASPFLDISAHVSCCGERGLLSVAFPPEYPSKEHFYVNYTNADGDTVVARYRLASDPDIADPNSEEVILFVDQPFSNHNGGQLAFGPDGYLYIGTGDGGSGGDPQNNGQRMDTVLGKLLRLDVESGLPPYTIPPDNPFVQTPTYRPEIWALGLRNPWRFSFDRETGDLYLGDVGQGIYEEIDFQSVASTGGENYGWRIMEGAHCFNSNSCNQNELTLPLVEYDHSQGCSVTGGFVYRGLQYPRLRGVYFYGDFCSGQLWGVQQSEGSAQPRFALDSSFNISTFGEDEAGELYLADYGSGDIYRIVDSTPKVGPDLTGFWQGPSHSCKGTSEKLKCKLKGSVVVQNTGTDIVSSASVQFYLSTDAMLSADDIFLREVSTGKLKPGRSKKRKLKVTLRGSTASGQYVVAVLDAANIIAEQNESNNQIVAGPLP